MLELRPSCECCDKDLPSDSTEARICSFECTFCTACATDKLKLSCPNCGGDLVQRPRRPASKLETQPAFHQTGPQPDQLRNLYTLAGMQLGYLVACEIQGNWRLG